MAQRREAGRHRREHDVSLVEAGDISRIQVCVRKGASDLLVQNINIGGRLLLRDAGLQASLGIEGSRSPILKKICAACVAEKSKKTNFTFAKVRVSKVRGSEIVRVKAILSKAA